MTSADPSIYQPDWDVDAEYVIALSVEVLGDLNDWEAAVFRHAQARVKAALQRRLDRAAKAELGPSVDR